MPGLLTCRSWVVRVKIIDSSLPPMCCMCVPLFTHVVGFSSAMCAAVDFRLADGSLLTAVRLGVGAVSTVRLCDRGDAVARTSVDGPLSVSRLLAHVRAAPRFGALLAFFHTHSN